MKIRSITYFLNPGWPLQETRLRRGADLVSAARFSFAAAGYQVQTVRLATTPFGRWFPPKDSDSLVRLAQALEDTSGALGFQYVSLGPALPDAIESYRSIPSVLAATNNVFLAGIMADQEMGVSLRVVRLCAEVIHQLSRVTPDGFTNLRFAALANLPGDAPFFPAAYSAADSPSFALALEAADLAIEAVSGAASLQEARQNLISDVEKHACQLQRVCTDLEHKHQITFKGLDFTLAPFPSKECSIGAALELLGVPAVGLHGSLAGVAFLTDALDRAVFQRAGFNGVFMPVLEDSVLASRSAEGVLSVKDLLLLSAVCGTGLDVVPLPGDITVDQIYSLLLDLAVLAIRLNKPLTARLMPIPGKRAGDSTGFDFEFFSNSRAMPVQSERLNRLLAGDEVLQIKSHR